MLISTAHRGPWPANRQLVSLWFVGRQWWKIIRPVLWGRVVNMSNFPAITDFLNKDYRYKTGATQITHDARLESVRNADCAEDKYAIKHDKLEMQLSFDSWLKVSIIFCKVVVHKIYGKIRTNSLLTSSIKQITNSKRDK